MSKRIRPVRLLEKPTGEPPQSEPGTVHISAEGDTCSSEEDLQARPKLLPPGAITDTYAHITEEYVQQCLKDFPEVHPGWKYAFTRSMELMNERRAAKAAREDQEPPPAPQPAEMPAEVLRVIRQKDRRTNRKLPRPD